MSQYLCVRLGGEADSMISQFVNCCNDDDKFKNELVSWGLKPLEAFKICEKYIRKCNEEVNRLISARTPF